MTQPFGAPAPEQPRPEITRYSKPYPEVTDRGDKITCPRCRVALGLRADPRPLRRSPGGRAERPDVRLLAGRRGGRVKGYRTYRILGTFGWVVLGVMLGMLAAVTGFVFVIEHAG